MIIDSRCEQLKQNGLSVPTKFVTKEPSHLQKEHSSQEEASVRGGSQKSKCSDADLDHTLLTKTRPEPSPESL